VSPELVSDNTNVEHIEVYNPRLIPSIARTFADKLEADAFGDVARVIVLVETDEGIIPLYWGGGITHVEAIGLLHLGLAEATERARADDLIEE
jgi:hypothetical protein